MVSDCEFHKWRCLIAMAHADGIVKPSESDFLNRHMDKLLFSDEQHQILIEDFKTPPDVTKIYPQIKGEDEKRSLVQKAFELFWVDDDFHNAEQEIFLFLRTGKKD